MPNLSRYTQKIFASTAGANQLSEYGSFIASPPGNLYSGSTITPEIVQALSNFLDGQYAATGGTYSPTIQDHNSLFYLFSYQLAYLFQLGIPEWDSDTTYNIGSIVQSSGINYVSLQNNNLNNAITDGSYWTTPTQNGVITPNSIPSDKEIFSGTTLSWPNMTIGLGKILTIDSGAYYEGINSVIVNGTFIVNGTARII